MCESVAQTVCLLLPAEDRERLLAVIADRNRPLKHVQRAHIVLFSADRLRVQEVARRAGVSRPDFGRKRSAAGRAGLVAQETIDFLLSISRLPAPNRSPRLLT